jgi:hypothetical protein
MRRAAARVALCLLVATPAFGQATSEWRTTHDLPVTVVEVAGGDVEFLVAVLPTEASPPEAVVGFPTTVTPQRGALLWTVRVPVLLTQPALSQFVQTLATTGAAAVVALGPMPARELEVPLAALEGVPDRPLPRLPCVLADGGVELRRGAPERVELSLTVPGPQDPRYDLMPALAALVRSRLLAAFPEVQVESELEGGCARLLVRLPAGNESPRLVLGHLRQTLATLPSATPTADEVVSALAACRTRAARAAVAGAAVAEELAERIALGGSVAGALASPALDSAALAELTRQVLEGHAGFATVVEQERRPQGEQPETLEDGAVLSVRWIPGDTGVVAIALGNMDPRAGRKLLTSAANAAADEGWATDMGEALGVPTLAVAAPSSAIIAVMERVSDSLTAAQPARGDDLDSEVAHAFGLSERATAESVSVALALPPEVDEGPEAGRKFFGSLPGAGVRTGPTLANPGLAWKLGDGSPQVVGTVELPATVAGVVAGQVVQDRLARAEGVRTFLLAPPGRPILALAGEGTAHVPALDARLADLWKGARRAAAAAEVTAAARRLFAVLYGDAAQATARAAASVFLPVVPGEAALLGIEAREVSAVLAGLPNWEKLARFARGRAPQVVVPPPRKRGMRESAPRR